MIIVYFKDFVNPKKDLRSFEIYEDGETVEISDGHYIVRDVDKTIVGIVPFSNVNNINIEE